MVNPPSINSELLRLNPIFPIHISLKPVSCFTLGVFWIYTWENILGKNGISRSNGEGQLIVTRV